MKQNLKEYMLLQTEKLLSIPSPTGYTKEVSEYLLNELKSMGYAPYTLNKGGVICRLNEGENALMLAAHVDTLGAMVKTIKGNGALIVTPLASRSFASKTQPTADNTTPALICFSFANALIANNKSSPLCKRTL